LLELHCRPEGLGVKLAERSDCKFYDKGNVRSKRLLEYLFVLLKGKAVLFAY
jgi:hypothetical protein